MLAVNCEGEGLKHETEHEVLPLRNMVAWARGTQCRYEEQSDSR